MKLRSQVLAFLAFAFVAFGPGLFAETPGQAPAPGIVPSTGASNEKATPAELGISSTQLSFQPLRAWTISSPRRLVLTNKSPKDLTINQLEVKGEFSLDPTNLPATLRPGKSMIVSVRFRPTQDGAASGQLRIASSSSVSPQEVVLLGTTPGLCSTSACTEVSLIAALCLLYSLALVVVRWNRVARPARELLKAAIWSLEAELATWAANTTNPGPAKARELLQAARGLVDGPRKPWIRVADFLFWSRGQEITGWRYIHEAAILIAQFLPEEMVNVRLESAEQCLRIANDPPSLALANAIHQELTGAKPGGLVRRRALLAEALAVNYNREDNAYADLVSWQNKTAWLVGCGLALTLVLTGALPHHGILFLVGGVGGLLSRLSRSLDRKEVPTDYGASWTTLFLSPVAGALGAWAGLLLAELAVELNVLAPAFAAKWTNPCDPMTLALALVFGFSERFLVSVLDKVVGKSGVDQTTATNPKPPQNVGSGAAGAAGAAEAARTAEAADSQLTISEQKLSAGKVGVPYSAQLSATGNVGDVQWFVKGSLPPGLRLEKDKITGTPTEQGTSTFIVEAANQKSKADREFTITINPAD